MPEATGSIDGTAGTSITATFSIDGVTFTYEATPTPAIEPFSSASATIAYDDVAQLDGTYPFTCFINSEGEVNYVVLVVDNGPKMLGGLDAPPSAPVDVSGTGTWASG